MIEINKTIGYGTLLTELKSRIHTAQYAALRAVNKELIALYWGIGQLIEERQTAEGWGKAIVERLSTDLRTEFGENSGFSGRNLWYMRTFYLEYKDHPKLQPMAAEIAWTKNTLILDRCANPLQREFYLRATARFGWTRRVLDHQIDNQTYEKYLLNQTSFDTALPQAVAAQAKLAVKDHYTFDFLELAEAHEERELETALIANVQRFLTEMGPHFTFVGSQYRLSVEGNDYHIDLLLYHRALKSLIAVELKIGEFQPEYKGKMEFYLVALNEQVKLPEENDAIGIIICKSKKKTVVEYALKNTTQPIGIATYSLTSHLPAALQHLLPSEADIRERLQGWDEQ
ncbi:MAG: PDDEXK nuclease domain-containing protein [Gallionella sp.]|nr:PDDEXK nuclease domain-containing protein [Gallionella sp.]